MLLGYDRARAGADLPTHLAFEGNSEVRSFDDNFDDYELWTQGTGHGRRSATPDHVRRPTSLLDTFERAKSCAAAEARWRSGKHLAMAYLDRHQLDEARDVAGAVLSEPSRAQLLSFDDVEFLRALLPRSGGSGPER